MELECDLGAIQSEELLRKMVSDVKVEVSKLHTYMCVYMYVCVGLQLICAYIRLGYIHTRIHKWVRSLALL